MTAPLLVPFGNADWMAILPATVVGLSALLVLLLDLTLPRRVRRGAGLAIGCLGLAAGGVLALQGWGHSYAAFAGGFMLGGFTIVFEAIVVIASLLTLLLSTTLGREDQAAGGVALVLWAASGAMLMAGAANLMTIFLGLELLSLALYCLCSLGPRATRARIGAQVPDSLLDGVGIHALRHGAALRRNGQRRTLGAARPARFDRTV